MADIRSLGELGKKKDITEVTFTFFGEDIRINSMLTELAYIDFVERASSVPFPEDPEHPTLAEIEAQAKSIPLVKDFLRELTHPDDFEKLWSIARMESYGLNDLMELAMSLIEAVTARPTGQPGDSSAGPEQTPAKSGASLSERVISRLENQGRPDLAQAVRMRERAEAAEQAARAG